MKGQVQPLIALMVALIVGIAVAVPVVIDFVSQATEAQSVTGEAVTCTNATTVTLDNDELLAGTFALTNGTVTIGSGNYTLSTTAGTVEFTTLDNDIYGSSCVASYNYYSDAYQDASTSRTLTGIVPLLIVVGLVLVVVAYTKLGG
jgi:hypothetical protein